MIEKFDCSLILLVENAEHDFVEHFLALHESLVSLDFTEELLLAVNGQGLVVKDCLKRWPAGAPDPVDRINIGFVGYLPCRKLFRSVAASCW